MITFTQNENKRYAPRWDVQANCACRMDKEGMLYGGHVEDVSCSGACITVDQDFEINQNLNLTLFLSEENVVRVCGTAVWTKVVNSQRKVGIHFFNTSSEAQETILHHAVNMNNELLTDHWFKDWEGR